MLDVYDLDSWIASGHVTEFVSGGNAGIAAGDWRPWYKPRGARQIMFYVLGGGAGGGAGFTRASTVAGGGGGGGSGGLAVLILPAFLCPDELYVQVGNGGLGGVNAQGSSGVRSRILGRPAGLFVAGDFLLASGTLDATGGGAGTGAAVGALGAASTIGTIAQNPLAAAGIAQYLAGQPGAAGGALANGVGTSLNALASQVVTGGTGGGGVTAGTSSGGAINGAGAFSTLAGGGPGARGNDGYSIRRPWASIGGTGGGASDALAGGFGGNGGRGSGGGGGGAGTTRGDGGRGGDGYVLIVVT